MGCWAHPFHSAGPPYEPVAKAVGQDIKGRHAGAPSFADHCVGTEVNGIGSEVFLCAPDQNLLRCNSTLQPGCVSAGELDRIAGPQQAVHAIVTSTLRMSISLLLRKTQQTFIDVTSSANS